MCVVATVSTEARFGPIDIVVPEVGVEDIVVGALNQRPKKSELSGWQNSMRKTFRMKCVNRSRDKKVRKSFFVTKKVRKSFLRQKST